MTERLGEVNDRIASARQISAVVSAMRAIAAARTRDARSRLGGVRRYAQSIAQAIGRTLPLAPQGAAASVKGGDRRLVVALGAEHGFAGGFSDRVLRAVDEARPDDLMLIGGRAIAQAEQRGQHLAWSAPMAAHLDQIEALADRIADEIWERVSHGVARVLLLHAEPDQPDAIVRRTLAPFDFHRFAQTRDAPPPLIQLDAPALLTRLSAEYVFAELCEALTLSFAAENEARIRAMTAARRHVSDIIDALDARARQLRQDDITNEVIELSSVRLLETARA